VKALLTEEALAQFEPTEYRFCGDPGCVVVYFGDNGSHFGTGDLRGPGLAQGCVGQSSSVLLLRRSEATISTELERTGRSFAIERIRTHITAGRCACEVRNPRGTCCLRDIMAAVKRLESTLARRASADAVTRVSGAS
jgi:hypothetical protein